MGRTYYWTIDQWENQGPYDVVERELPENDEDSEILVQDLDDTDWTDDIDWTDDTDWTEE